MTENATRSRGEGLDEVDVLVVGYGAAGAAAALAAHDAGARVLVVEKCAQPGGNSLVSSANTVYPAHPDDVERFGRYLTEVCDGTTPAEVIEAYVKGLVALPAWLESMGGELENLDDPPMGSLSSYYIPNLTFPQLPGAHGLSLVLRQLKQTQRCPQPTGGARMWHLLAGQLTKRGIPVRCGTSVLDLLTDGSGRVTGAVVQSDGGREQVRAQRAVVLACGGFAYSEVLKREHLAASAVGALGSPGNTGDGLRMAHKVGAGLWHLGEEASALGIVVEGFDAGFAVNLPRPGFVYVDRMGHRFVDEVRVEAHTACRLTANYDPATFDYPRVRVSRSSMRRTSRAGRLASACFPTTSSNLGMSGARTTASRSIAGGLSRPPPSQNSPRHWGYRPRLWRGPCRRTTTAATLATMWTSDVVRSR